MKPLSAEQKIAIKNDGIALCLLTGFAFFINRGITIKGLYMDDLSLWACYGEQSFLQYVFPTDTTRFRVLFNLITWLELRLLGPHVSLVVPINILLNSMLAFFLYYVGRRMSGRGFLGFLGGGAFLLSRMSYYQIGQLYGQMETIALWMAVGILYGLYQYVNKEQENLRYLYGSCLLYFGVCFVHERYIALLPLFYLALMLRRNFRLKAWLWPTWQIFLVLVIRFIAIGSWIPAGTGGTEVSETFSFLGAIRYAFSQVGYVFGINAGPQYLNGLAWADTPWPIRLLVYGADLVLALLVLAFLKKMVTDQENRGRYLANTALFFLFIAMCIGSSSVTVRVEMRWVYVSYAAALLFLNYICGVLAPVNRKEEESYRRRRRSLRRSAVFCVNGFLLYVLLMIPVELFFRGHFYNLYLWPDQLRFNSLAEETYGRYGEAILGKTIYIIGDSYSMKKGTEENFFKVFDPKRKAEGTKMVIISDQRDIGLVTDEMLILREDPEHDGFQDITQIIKEVKLKVDYGLYDDGLMDEDCHFSLLTGEKGKISFEFAYPGPITGSEEMEIYVAGKWYQTIPVTVGLYHGEIQAEPYQIVDIQIKSNFYIPNALEQRGETRLAAIVEIQVE